jgi:hypothetical protein
MGGNKKNEGVFWGMEVKPHLVLINIVFLWGLFNHTVSSSGYVSSSGRMIDE